MSIDESTLPPTTRYIGPVAPPGVVHPPAHTTLTGRYTTLVPLAPAHAAPLTPLVLGAHNAHLWDYMSDGPFLSDASAADFAALIAHKSVSADPLFFAVMPSTDAPPTGFLSLMRITPAHRTLEIGNVLFAAPLQRTRAATEVIYLLLVHAFTSGYHRVEWKCNALNEPSKRAAERFGFRPEGVFRQHMIIKGRVRDTAWFAMTEDDWTKGVRRALEEWLDEANFDDAGRQRKRLEEFRA